MDRIQQKKVWHLVNLFGEALPQGVKSAKEALDRAGRDAGQ
jgi:hypothetical protein